MKLYLTEKFIRDYVIPAGLRQQLLFDLGLSRFAVSITARGAKSYVIVYRDMEGRQRQEKLADAGTVTLRAARSFALARLQELDAHRQSKGRCGPCPTMDSFFCQIFFPIVKAQSRSYATHAGLYRNHIQNAFGARRLDDISEDDVLAFHAALTTKPVSGKNVGIRTLSEGTVKRIMILLRHILNEAIRHKGNPLTSNPTHIIKLKAVRKIKGRFLTRDQLGALLNAATQSSNTNLPDIVRVMGGTGLRRENVLSMKWAWFDEARGTLSIPAEHDKAKKGFILHVSSDVRTLLSERKDDAHSEWVFPNPKTGKPYHSCRNAWVTACERAGLEGLRMHDMRHTFASMMLDNGADIVDVQQALAHTQLKTTAVYLHLTEARKRIHANAASHATGLFA